jgi:hypothetical protein
MTRGGLESKWALFLVLILAAVFRFHRVTGVGIRFDDEAWYVSDARLWHRCARTLLDDEAWSVLRNRDRIAFRAQLDQNGVDFADRYRKPVQGYTFLGALMMFLGGDGPRALLVLNAACGTLAVAALYGIAAAWWGRRVALCAAFLLAVSPYHLVYCRSALTEATAGLFVLTGVYFWRGTAIHGMTLDTSRQGRAAVAPGGLAGICSGRGNDMPSSGTPSKPPARLLSGIFLGLAATCHYRTAIVPAVLALADLLSLCWQSKTNKTGFLPTDSARGGKDSAPPATHFLRRLLGLAIGFALPILAIEFLFRCGQWAASAGKFPPSFPTFLESAWAFWTQLQQKLGAGDSLIWNPEVLLAHVEYAVHWQGWPALIFTLLGMLMALRAKGPAKWAAILPLIALAVLPFQRYVVARAMAPMIPMVCLCQAVGICAVASWFTRFKGPASTAWPVAIIMFLSALPGLENSARLLTKRGGLAEACSFLANRGAQTVAVPLDAQPYKVCLDGHNLSIISIERLRGSRSAAEVLDQLAAEGIQWIVTDPRYWHFRSDKPTWNATFEWWEEFEAELAKQARLAISIPHLDDFRREFLAEGWGTGHLEEITAKCSGAIRIYELFRLSPSGLETIRTMPEPRQPALDAKYQGSCRGFTTRVRCYSNGLEIAPSLFQNPTDSGR